MQEGPVEPTEKKKKQNVKIEYVSQVLPGELTEKIGNKWDLPETLAEKINKSIDKQVEAVLGKIELDLSGNDPNARALAGRTLKYIVADLENLSSQPEHQNNPKIHGLQEQAQLMWDSDGGMEANTLYEEIKSRDKTGAEKESGQEIHQEQKSSPETIKHADLLAEALKIQQSHEARLSEIQEGVRAIEQYIEKVNSFCEQNIKNITEAAGLVKQLYPDAADRVQGLEIMARMLTNALSGNELESLREATKKIGSASKLERIDTAKTSAMERGEAENYLRDIETKNREFMKGSLQKIGYERSYEKLKANFIKFFQKRIMPVTEGLFSGKRQNPQTEELYQGLLNRINGSLKSNFNVHVLNVRAGEKLSDEDFEYIEPSDVVEGKPEQSETIAEVWRQGYVLRDPKLANLNLHPKGEPVQKAQVVVYK